MRTPSLGSLAQRQGRMAGRGGLGLPGCLWVCSYSAEALCAAGWEVAGWLAVWLGFARVSRTFCQRGFKVAALSSHYQLGFFFSFLLQIESHQGFIGFSVPRMALLLPYLGSLPCHGTSCHTVALGRTPLSNRATTWPCSQLPHSQIPLVFPKRCEFTRDEDGPGSCMDSDSG